MTTSTEASSAGTPPLHKRKLRNFLLDIGLQIRYTAFIITVAVFLTGVLGYKIYEKTREASKIVGMSDVLDPGAYSELQAQLGANDRWVLFGIGGFGVVLVLSIAGAGIWITHKVAGPLYSIANICTRIRDNKITPSLRQLRKGDELQEFYASFRDMHEALRARVANDTQVIGNAIAVLEMLDGKSPQVHEVLTELKELRRQKEQSLDPT